MFDVDVTCRLVFDRGAPHFAIDGQPTPPLIFFFNNEVPKGQHYLRPQVEQAAAAGIHIYSLVLPWPFTGDAPDYSAGEQVLDAFIAADPQAMFIPRIRCEGSAAWMKAHPEECVQFATGQIAEMTSLGSDAWMRDLQTGLKLMIQHYSTGRHAGRMLGYHPASQSSNEWFHFNYFQDGPDVSATNRRAFGRWLRGRYDDSAALSAAWGQEGIDFETAQIPLPQLELGKGEDRSYDVFLNPATEQQRIDFTEYSSWIVGERVEAICSLIRRETEGNKLIVLFYGYCLELPGVAGGHYAMERMLDSANVDIFASPISYHDRQPGNAGSFMTAVDSLPLHGKLWIVENDTRTHLWDTRPMEAEGWLDASQITIYRDPFASQNLLVRDFGAMQTHRSGTWWMDLIAGGAYNDPVFWEQVRETFMLLQRDLMGTPTAYRPEIAVIHDEDSNCALRCTNEWDGGQGEDFNPAQKRTSSKLRDVIARTGTASGTYYLGDFLSGLMPRCKAYVFANLYRTTAAMIAKIHARLAEEGATAIWLYGAGWRDEAGDGAAAMRRLTGFEIATDAGTLESRGAGEFEGLGWGEGLRLAPRFVIAEREVEVLGTYAADGATSAARKAHAGYTSVFIGDPLPSAKLLARLFAQAGAHLWSEDAADVMQTDGRLLMLHAGEAGERTIHLPEGLEYESMPTGEPSAVRDGAITVSFKQHQTHLIMLGRK